MTRATPFPARRGGGAAAGATLLFLLLTLPADAEWQFQEVGAAAGAAVVHAFDADPSEPRFIAGGVAVGDVDGDGWPDLLVVRGTAGPPVLLRNRGDGGFDDATAGSGLDFATTADPGAATVNGPSFADLDGDGRLDLVVGGIDGSGPRIFRNQGPGFFEEVATGIVSARDTFSTAFADWDRDGDLDLFLAHWGRGGGFANHLWRNDGDFAFSPIDWSAGIAPLYLTTDFTFTPNFADLDDDGWPDLLLASDFGTSRVFRNTGVGGFDLDSRIAPSDENGMGAAVGDVDNDGDLDWFVSSIWDPDGVAEGPWGVTGNRLYLNRGDGGLDDATEESGLRHGYWGWGSCLGDFDLDGWLDLFHTNGFPGELAADFEHDPSRLFVNRGDGTFDERSAELGITDDGQGRGVVCFDYDGDGDLDLFVQNHSGTSRLYRNELPRDGEGPHYLAVRLIGSGANRQAIGARLEIEVAGGLRQIREVRAGSNFLSQNPATVHFGLAGEGRADRLHIRWPDGELETLENVGGDRLLTLRQGAGGEPAVVIPTLGATALLAQGLVLAVLACALLLRRRARSLH